jgi:hypothetical protein
LPAVLDPLQRIGSSFVHRRHGRAAVLTLSLLVVGGLVAVFLVAFSAWPTDAWTYLAAGERLNAGHELYRLQAGDRPVGIRPSEVPIPLLSPPLIAVLWRPIALLPPDVAISLWWVTSALAIGVVVAGMVRSRPGLGLAATLTFALPLAYLVVTGNVNGLLVGGMTAVWLLVRAKREAAAGVLIALMTGVKVVPATLLVWLLASSRDRALAWALGTGVVLLGVSVVGAGLANHLAYLDVVAYAANVGRSQFSLADIALVLGAPEGLARALPFAALAVGLAATWEAGRRGNLAGSFTAAVYTMVWGSSIVNFDWLALMFAGLAPAFWPPRDARLAAGRTRAAATEPAD